MNSLDVATLFAVFSEMMGAATWPLVVGGLARHRQVLLCPRA